MTPSEKAHAEAEITALNTLLASQWWNEECENANYHSIHGFMEESRDERKEQVAEAANASD